MVSATAPVRSVSAARIRRCLAPWPSRTSDPAVIRWDGIPRAAAASTIERVLGPSWTSSRSFRSRFTSAATSNGVSWIAARSSSRAVWRHSIANASSL